MPEAQHIQATAWKVLLSGTVEAAERGESRKRVEEWSITSDHHSPGECHTVKGSGCRSDAMMKKYGHCASWTLRDIVWVFFKLFLMIVKKFLHMYHF